VRVPPFASTVFGVGNNPDPIPLVRRADMDSTHHARPPSVTECFQVSENPVCAAISERRHVFSNDPSWADFSDKSGKFAPQSASGAIKADTFSGNADVLAGEATTDCVNGNSVSGKPVCTDGGDIMIAPHLRPMLCQHPPRKRVNFTESGGVETARALQPKRETANA
jgi:hypothetical protein